MNRLISIQDLDAASLYDLVETGQRLSDGELDFSTALKGKLVGLYFSKPSTRTRTSFFAAVERMGGSTILYSAADLQVTTGESLEDTGMVLGLYLDAFVMRTNGSFDEMITLAESGGGMSVVNALSKAEHPTQAIADLITIRQEFGQLDGRHVLYIGAWNNTAASLVLALSKLPQTTMTIMTPDKFAPDDAQIDAARRNASESGSSVKVLHDLSMLPRAVDVVYTVRWQSMGDEPADPAWRESFRGFKVTRDFMRSVSHEGTIFMHDLPAHRDIEVEAEVIDGPASRVRRQALNKMFSAMCVLERCLKNRRRAHTGL
ncbi:MAG TPA: ornithine carbamoyltransferase [Blastocatellia bacterium]|jgi:ornithine carbamoyltransferase